MVHEPRKAQAISSETTMTKYPQSFFQFVALIQQEYFSCSYLKLTAIFQFFEHCENRVKICYEYFFFLGEILSYDVQGYPRTADAMRPGKNDRYASARGIEFREAGKPRTIAIRTLESLLPPKSNPIQVRSCTESPILRGEIKC